jgi:hypothetical protein
MRIWLNSTVAFVIKMLCSAAISLLGISFILSLITQLDIAFFESNGMIRSAEMREAFYYQIFDLDLTIMLMLALGFVGVAVIAFVFCKSHFNYFHHLADALRKFADTGEAPLTRGLGRFNPFIIYFFDVMERRFKGAPNEELTPVLEKARREWPTQPGVSIKDQLQFVSVSAFLGIFFSLCSATFYFKVNSKVVELAHQLVRFSSASGPNFLNEQFEIVTMLVWMILVVTTITFAIIGYRFGVRIGAADYALLRDLKVFMEGNFEKTLFLRRGDPASELISGMNESLKKIGERARQTGKS